MADSWTQNVACRYFKNGICREGNNCRYRHVQGSVSIPVFGNTTIPIIATCRFFKQGICKFGSQCRFRHTTQSGDNLTSTGNSTENASNVSTDIKDTKARTSGTMEEWMKSQELVPLHGTSSSDALGSSTSSGNEEACGSTDSHSMPMSYAQAVNPTGQASSPSVEPLCPYAESIGICKTINCTYLHGDICELCGCAALHPHNEDLRKKHTDACVKQHEVDMELSFAIQRSRDKSCGICFETVMEKPSSEQRFGILPNCNHCFCLTCIRKWRQAKQFDNKIIKSCPECRIPSDFVCPSMYWVDTTEDKEKIIMDYKGALSTKDCKYFQKGRGTCPFGNKCFYLHAFSDRTKRGRRQNSEDELLRWSTDIESFQNSASYRDTYAQVRTYLNLPEDTRTDDVDVQRDHAAVCFAVLQYTLNHYRYNTDSDDSDWSNSG